MAKLTITNEADVEPGTDYGHDVAIEGLRASRTLSPDGYSLRLVTAELDDGATLRWPETHGDEGIYVRAGALRIDDREVPVGGAVVVEADAPCTAVAVGPTEVVHLVSTVERTGNELRPPVDGEARHVHVVAPEDGELNRNPRGQVLWYLDGRCPTCRVQFFKVDRFDPGEGATAGAVHHHSEDEIIFILEGSLRTGSVVHPAGTALSIPADVRYALTPTRGHTFLNFRPDLSTITFERDSDPLVEIPGAFDGPMTSPDD